LDLSAGYGSNGLCVGTSYDNDEYVSLLAHSLRDLAGTRNLCSKINSKNIFFNGGKLAEQPKAKNDFLHQKSIK
jgi:hypothetical protein